ncbi:MAG: FecR domain-containing protein [Patescibacteria group bacterium]
MFNFWRQFSNSPEPSSFELVLGRIFAVPSLDATLRRNVKKRILNRIVAECEELRNAEILDKKLSGKKVASSGLLDLLAALAEKLLSLPRVWPQVGWRESARQNFRPSRGPRFFAFFRQATAFAMLLIVAGSVTLTTFISQTQAVAAQLSVNSGVVKIRVADSPFFEEVKKVATVRLGDTIRVEANATAELAFYDQSKMHLTESTEVAITAFKPDFLSRGKSELKVALVSGAVDAEVAKADSSFAVETPTGSVEAQSAKFSVAVNPDNGSTKIETSEDMVAVKSSKNEEAVALLAGESVVFAENKEEVLVAADSVASVPAAIELPSLDQFQGDLELVKIRSFDALIAAQAGDVSVAQKIVESVQQKLADLLALGQAESGESGVAVALTSFLQKNYADSTERSLALQNLQQTVEVGQILNYYFTAPQKLRGVPALAILARDHYTPSGRLRNLFAALRAGELAHAEVRPLVEQLSGELVAELSLTLTKENSTELVTEFLAEMQDQPIFLPALQRLQPLVAADLAEKVAAKIETLNQILAKYIGG